MSPRYLAPPSKFRHNRYLRRCQLCGIIGHSARQWSHLPTSALGSLPPTPTRAPHPAFTVPYAHITVHASSPSTSLDWVVDSDASHHVNMDLAALALYAPYTTSNSVIISDGSGLSISNIGSFSLTSPPPYTFIFFSNVLHVPTMSENLISISSLCADNPINVLFFDSFFQVQDRHMGVTLVRE